MIPEPGLTYYLKEVPDVYFSKAKRTILEIIQSNEIDSFWLHALMDDSMYRAVGFIINDIEVRGTINKTMTLTQIGTNETTVVSSETIFDTPNASIINVLFNDYKNQTGSFDLYAYYVTYDKVMVVHKKGTRMNKPNTTSVGITMTDISRDDYIIRAYE